MIFKKLINDEEGNNLDFVFMLKIQPNQVKKLEIHTDETESVSLSMEFRSEDNRKHFFLFNSLELPVTVLYEKLMKIIYPLYEERSLSTDESDNKINELGHNNSLSSNTTLTIPQSEQQSVFLKAVDSFVKNTDLLIKRGINFINSSLNGVKNLISPTKQTPIKSINSVRLEDVQRELESHEMLTLVNKIHLNYIDTAYTAEDDINILEFDKKGKILSNSQIKSEIEIINRPIILFIPPFGFDMYIYKNYFVHFSQQYRIIAYDQRGHGGSEQHKTDKYAFSDYVQDLKEFIQRIPDNNQPLTLVTASLTAFMLINNVSKLKFRASDVRIVLLSFFDNIDQSMQKIIKNLPHPRLWGVLKRTGKAKAKNLLFSQKTPDEAKEYILNNMFQTDHRVAFETLKNLTSKSCTKEIEKKQFKFNKDQKIKFLILNGDADIFVKQENTLRLSEIIHGVTINIVNGNHFFMFENPITTIQLIESWLKK